MGKAATTLLLATLVGLVALEPGWAQTAAAGTVRLYVAPNGRDDASGLAPEPREGDLGPLATMAGAQEAIRAMRRKGAAPPVEVLLREGTYTLSEPVVFGPDDGGLPGSSVTYAAYPGETPVLSGGRRLTGWRQEGDLWAVDLPEVRSGHWYFSALWVNGVRRTVARTPNDGYFHAAGKVGEGHDPSRAFRYNPGDIAPFANLDDARVIVYHSWATSIHRIAALDEANGIVTFTGTARWPFGQWDANQRYYVENVREALDAPGEWYLDRKAGVLYYMPMPGEDMSQVEAVAPVAPQLLLIQGRPAENRFVRDLHFRGLTFRYTDSTIPAEGHSEGQADIGVPGAIHAVGAHFCSVSDCTVAHVGTYGIAFRAGCVANTITRNEITDMGAGGVAIGETYDPRVPGELAGRNVVDNNFIHDGGLIYPAAVGVWLGRTSHNRVSHNEICDLFYTGVSVGWSWGYQPSSANHNIIEYNHIHHIGKGVLSDMGGIYLLGIAPGTVVRYNLIHDVNSFSYGGWGIYPDEGSSYLLIENNIAHDTKSGGFHQHYGRGNVVTNNIFAFAREGQVIRTRDEDHTSFFFERNIVVFDNGKPLGSSWANDKYWINSNVYWDVAHPSFDFAGQSFEDWKARGHDTESIIADPLFVNLEARDFRLKPESPALTLGFVPIDMTKTGLYDSKDWVSRPKAITR